MGLAARILFSDHGLFGKASSAAISKTTNELSLTESNLIGTQTYRLPTSALITTLVREGNIENEYGYHHIITLHLSQPPFKFNMAFLADVAGTRSMTEAMRECDAVIARVNNRMAMQIQDNDKPPAELW